MGYGLNTLGPLGLWQYFVCRFKNLNKCFLGIYSRLRCFVANFIAGGFTRFFVLIFLDKSALVLIFTLLECLVKCAQYPTFLKWVVDVS